MNGIGSAKKLLFAVVFLTVFVSPAMAEWDITVPNHVPTDGDSIFTSEGNQTIVFVEIRTQQFDEPVTDSGTTEASEFVYRYNESDGQRQNLTYYRNGLWYAKFNADLSKHGMSNDNAKIRFDVKGDRQLGDDVGSGGYKNTTLNLKAGMHDVDLVQGLPSTVVPGQTFNITANVTNRTTGEPVNMTNVYTYFRNASWTQNGNYDLNYNQSTELFKGEVTIPQGYDSKYLMRVESKNRSDNAPENSQGLYSEFVGTAKEFKGHVQNLTNIQGCTTSLDDETPDAAECEPGATLDTVYNVTGPEPDSVTVSAYRRNSSSNELEQYFETSMNEDQEGLYSSEISIPDLNTSAYDKEITLNFNATREGRSHVDVKTLGYSALEVINVGTRSAVQGEPYDLSVQTVKPKSLTPWTDSRIESMEVNVSDTDGDLFGSYNLSNFTFNSQGSAFEEEIMIPEQADIGRWNLQIRASDIYGEVRSKSSGFGVSSSEQTFDINDTVFEKDEQGVEDFNISVRNLLGQDITLDTNVSEGLDSEINLSDSVEISDDLENVSVTVNLTSFESVDGYVNFTDAETGYKQSVGLSIDVRSCQFSAGDICSLSGKWVNVTADSRGDYTEEVVIQNNAEDGEATNITTVLGGNISDLVQVKDQYTVEDEVAVQINYSVEEIGNYTGTVAFEPDNSSSRLVYNTSLETTFFSTGDSDFSIEPGIMDLGAFPSGMDKSSEIDVQNNGELAIENITAESFFYTMDLNETGFNLSAGDSKTVNLTLQNLTMAQENITFTGDTASGEVETMLEVNATPLLNYSSMAQLMRASIQQARPVSDDNLSTTLDELSDTVSYVRGNWSEGNYLVSRNLYETGQNRLEYVQENRGSSSAGGEDDEDTGGSEEPQEPPTDQGDTGGSDDPDTGGSDESNPSSSEENSGGGLPIIPIVVLLVVLGIAGFVFYESYIPEEGDPLYGVLGDGE